MDVVAEKEAFVNTMTDQLKQAGKSAREARTEAIKQWMESAARDSCIARTYHFQCMRIHACAIKILHDSINFTAPKLLPRGWESERLSDGSY